MVDWVYTIANVMQLSLFGLALYYEFETVKRSAKAEKTPDEKALLKFS